MEQELIIAKTKIEKLVYGIMKNLHTRDGMGMHPDSKERPYYISVDWMHGDAAYHFGTIKSHSEIDNLYPVNTSNTACVIEAVTRRFEAELCITLWQSFRTIHMFILKEDDQIRGGCDDLLIYVEPRYKVMESTQLTIGAVVHSTSHVLGLVQDRRVFDPVYIHDGVPYCKTNGLMRRNITFKNGCRKNTELYWYTDLMNRRTRAGATYTEFRVHPVIMVSTYCKKDGKELKNRLIRFKNNVLEPLIKYCK